MKCHRILAAVALLALPPAITVAAPSWQPAMATSVSAGVNSKSTFVIQASVTLPQSCYAAHIVSVVDVHAVTRQFFVMQQAPSSKCNTQTSYKCTVVSSSINLPIPHSFEVDSKGKTWKVHVAPEPPTPIEPMCRKG